MFTFRRLDDTVIMKMMYGTIETPEGEVLRLDTRTLASDNEIRVHGDAIKGEMKLIMEGHEPAPGGDHSLGQGHSRPLCRRAEHGASPWRKARRAIKMYIPDLNRVVDFTFKAGPISEIPLGDGSRRPLRKVEQTASLDGKPQPVLATTLGRFGWPGAQARKRHDGRHRDVSHDQGGRHLACPRGTARFDEIRSTMIAINKIIPDPRQTRYVQYRLTLKDGDPAQIFPADGRQTISRAGQELAGPECDRRPARRRGRSGRSRCAVSPAQRHHHERGRAGQDDWRKGPSATQETPGTRRPDRALGVREHPGKNFAIAFAPASEVARNLSGDCSEHAVLAAAMCRAVGIPSRVAVGLLYVDNESQQLKGFGYHVWHEVYVNQRWVALDSSWDQSSVDATHIKLADTSLEGVAPFEAFLPIARIQGKLEIDPIEMR